MKIPVLVAESYRRTVDSRMASHTDRSSVGFSGSDSDAAPV